MTKSRITGVLSQLLLTAVISPILAVSSLSDGGDHEMFNRRDPLNSFRYYHGGFNVRDKHYWAVSLLSYLLRFYVIFYINFMVNVVTKC